MVTFTEEILGGKLHFLYSATGKEKSGWKHDLHLFYKKHVRKKLSTSTPNISLDEDVLKTPSARLQRNNFLSSKTSLSKIVTLHYGKKQTTLS